MISIRYDRQEGRIWVKGHACFAEKGQDIVCAAISALYETLAIHQHTYAGQGRDDERYVWVRPGLNELMRPIMDTFAAGMQQIAKQFPNHVEFEQINPEK